MIKTIIKIYNTIIIISLYNYSLIIAQNDLVKYVNPLIGTAPFKEQ